jgi:hypothetical protein
MRNIKRLSGREAPVVAVWLRSPRLATLVVMFADGQVYWVGWIYEHGGVGDHEVGSGRRDREVVGLAEGGVVVEGAVSVDVQCRGMRSGDQPQSEQGDRDGCESPAPHPKTTLALVTTTAPAGSV